MPSTFTHGVVPAACLVLSGKSKPKTPRAQWIRLAFVGFFLGNAPDLDVIPGTLWASHWADIHRNWGHNIFSILALTWFGTFLFKKLVQKEYRPKYLWLTSFVLIMTHVVFDSMGGIDPTTGLRAGVPILWPIADFQIIAPFEIFMSYTVDSSLPPLIAHILSTEFWSRAVFTEVIFTATLIPSWLVVLYFGRKLRARTQKTETLPEEIRVAS